MRVERHNWYGERTHRSPPQLAASASYFKIWPAVRETAGHITKECFSDSIESNAGYSIINIDLDGQNVEYVVIVGEGMCRLPEKSRPFAFGGSPEVAGQTRTHHLYTADEGAREGRTSSSPLLPPSRASAS